MLDDSWSFTVEFPEHFFNTYYKRNLYGMPFEVCRYMERQDLDTTWQARKIKPLTVLQSHLSFYRRQLEKQRRKMFYERDYF